MNEDAIIHLSVELLWIVLLLSMPTVLVASIIGVIISLVQTLTQIQDQTLQFLIKLIAVSIALVATYHWMGATMLNYTHLVFDQIARMR
jgi:type III secretion protein S